MAAPWVDWRLASEIEPFPRAVLAERFGYALPVDQNQGEPLLWGDFTEVGADLAARYGIPLPDILVAGTPCQAFSIAGNRAGVSDARGNLTLKFIEVCHAIVDARPDGKLTVLWENVPGVLSDKDNAFGCFLGGLVGGGDPLHTPDGGSWPGAGMVAGPRARIAWRVFDAQYFGVAQRRRRVFLIADFGGRADPAAILFEPQGMHGNSAPRREAGQACAGTLSARAQGGSGHLELAGGLQPVEVPDVARCLTTGGNSRIDMETETIFPVAFAENSRGELRLEGGDGSRVGALGAADGGKPGQGRPAIVHAFNMRGREGGAAFEGPSDVASLRAASVGASRSFVCDGWAVRRLLPVEAHRLQGFPEDHCAIPYRGKPAADGPQFKALGNSMAVPNIAWIMDRIRAAGGWP